MSQSPDNSGPTYIDIEATFDSFVSGFPGANRIDQLFKPYELQGPNADYYFAHENVLVELKSLEADQASADRVTPRLKNALERSSVPRNRWGAIVLGLEPIPLDVRKRLFASSQNAMRNALRKANRQLQSSQALIGNEARTLAIFANDRDHLFGPAEALRCLAGLALELSDCCIDGIVYTTPNVFYDDGSGVPRQYWAPVYGDGKEALGSFVDHLGKEWIDYSGNITGDLIECTRPEWFSKQDLGARPIKDLGKG